MFLRIALLELESIFGKLDGWRIVDNISWKFLEVENKLNERIENHLNKILKKLRNLEGFQIIYRLPFGILKFLVKFLGIFQR